MKITGYLSLTCASEVELRKNIASALQAEGVSADVSIRRIDEQQAANLRLSGSPSILIDGKVLQPSSGTGFS